MRSTQKKKISRPHLTVARVRRLVFPVLQKYPIRKAALFGSVVSGEMTPSSDVDMLIQLDPKSKIGLFEFVGIKRALEEKVGRTVDLATFNSLHPLLKRRILDSKKIIYEKRPFGISSRHSSSNR